MTPERWREIKEAFEAVDSAPPQERDSVLARVCEGNESLRGELEALLKNAHGESSFDELVEGLVGAQAASLAFGATPSTIGPYQIKQLIGSGGMGEVYLAEDGRLGRQVALKVLPAAYAANSDRIRRFQQEARAASALNHPNIVTIHDFGQADGLYYMATEYVRGQTLRDLMAGGPLPARQVAQIAVQVVGALVAAHDAGIVHRDIKPENIMMRPDGYIKVLDFGLAKLREPSSAGVEAQTLTKTGTIMGTTAYMSPEQVRGLPVDGVSDIFSLGVVLYEMVSGRNPFRGKTGADQIAALLEHEPQPVGTLVPSVPPSLAAIITKALQKDRRQRYGSTQALLDDLRAFQREIDSGASQQVGTVARNPRRRPALIGGLIAVGLVGVAVAVILYFREPDWYRNNRLSAVPRDERAGHGIISPSGRYLAYMTDTPEGLQGIHVRLLNAAQAVEVVRPEVARHYGFAIAPDENYLYYTVDLAGAPTDLYRVPLLGGAPQRVAQNVRGVAFSPDGAKIAFARHTNESGSLWIADADGSNARLIGESREARRYFTFAWSHDAKEVFYTEGARTPAGQSWGMWAASLKPGVPPRLVFPLTKTIMGLGRLPDGSGFIVNAIETEINRPQIWRLSMKGEWKPITHDLNEYQGLSLTSDGHRTATNHATRQTELWVADLNDASKSRQITSNQPGFGTPAWSLRGGIVATAGGSGGNFNIWSMAPDGSGKRLLPAPGSISESQPASCPDREEIVFVSERKGTANLWRIRPDGGELKQLTFGVSDIYPQCIGGGIVVYRSQVGKQIQTLQIPLDGGTPSPVNDASWENQISADGTLKLVNYADGKTHKRHLAVKTRDGSRTLLDIEADVGALDPAAKGVAYISRRDGSMEMYYQAISGGPPRKVTHFGDKLVFGFDWAPDGRSIVCAVGRIMNSLVLIDDVR